MPPIRLARIIAVLIAALTGPAVARAPPSAPSRSCCEAANHAGAPRSPHDDDDHDHLADNDHLPDHNDEAHNHHDHNHDDHDHDHYTDDNHHPEPAPDHSPGHFGD